MFKREFIALFSLKTLVIKYYWNREEYGGENEENNWLEVVTPNLEAFQVSGRFQQKCRLVNASSLVSANLMMWTKL